MQISNRGSQWVFRNPAKFRPNSLIPQFSDQSTAAPLEKAKRVLRALSALQSSTYLFEDGFARTDLIEQDAAASLAVIEGLVSHALAGAAQGQRHALWLLTEDTIHQYLMSNAKGRWDGAQKAQAHITLCCFFIAVERRCRVEDVRVQHEATYQAVHRATQMLTDNLDEEIGFPLEEAPDYDRLAPLFFDRFEVLATQALRRLSSSK